MIEAVTLDVTNTLIHCPRLGEIYAEVLSRHGVPVDPREARRLVSIVWQELSCSADPGRDRFTSHPEGERGWWMRFLERICEHLEAPPPSRFAASELFHRFGGAEAWEVFPEVPEALSSLAAGGVRLGVVSNWDHRLPGVLEKLELARFFEAVVYSSAVGVEKPDGRIFAAALSRLGVPAEAALHVGDSPLEDVEGAMAVGMRALHLTRERTRGAGAGDLSDLTPLPSLVGLRPVLDS
jgi:putative hydrolase of the HAD superfamily